MNPWTKEWPTEPGWYWFYGQTSRQLYDRPPRMMLVKVSEIVNGVCYVTEGRFLYKAEGARGLWVRAYRPQPPTDEFIAIFAKED